MFQKFLAEHSLDEYSFRDDFLPTVEDRDFWENYPNDACIAEAEAALANFAAAVYATKKERCRPLSHITRTLRRLIFEARALRQMAAHQITYPLHGAVEYLPDLQIAALRRGSLTLHAKGGHNKEGHNHNDVGSFTLYDGNTPVLVDVGINTYTGLHFKRETRYTAIPRTRSCNHNLPLINGVEQKSAREHCAEDFPVRVEGDAVILGECCSVRAKGAKIATDYIPFQDEKLEADWHAEGVTRICLILKTSKKFA